VVCRSYLVYFIVWYWRLRPAPDKKDHYKLFGSDLEKIPYKIVKKFTSL